MTYDPKIELILATLASQGSDDDTLIGIRYELLQYPETIDPMYQILGLDHKDMISRFLYYCGPGSAKRCQYRAGPL